MNEYDNNIRTANLIAGILDSNTKQINEYLKDYICDQLIDTEYETWRFTEGLWETIDDGTPAIRVWMFESDDNELFKQENRGSYSQRFLLLIHENELILSPCENRITYECYSEWKYNKENPLRDLLK